MPKYLASIFIQLIFLATAFAQQPSYKVLFGNPRCSEGFYDAMRVRGANSGLTIYIDVEDWRRLSDENFRTQALNAALRQNLEFCQGKRAGSVSVVVVRHNGDAILIAWKAVNDRSWNVTLDRVQEFAAREPIRETKPTAVTPSAIQNPSPSTSGGPSIGSVIDGISGFLIFVGGGGYLIYRFTRSPIKEKAPDYSKGTTAEEMAQLRTQNAELDEKIKVVDLPPPVTPERPLTPIKGIMRVDVTQTEKTVDVWVVLSEEAKFLVEKNKLADIPIEENLDGLQAFLKGHMMTYADEYDADTLLSQRSADTYRDPYMDVINKQVVEDVNRQTRDERTAKKKYALKAEQDRATEEYKRIHTVTLRQYLTTPYRRIVSNRLEANEYMKQLEKEYLPRIKSLIESSPASGGAQRSYEF